MPRACSILLFALTLACTREPEPSTRAAPDSAPATHPAVGSLAGLSPTHAAAFADSPHFAPLREPSPDDWLASHKEPGQTVAQFIAKPPNTPTAERSVIYIVPIGEFPSLAPSMQTFERYAEAFFQLDVTILEPITVESLNATTREWDYGPQLRTDEALVALGRLLPEDGFLLAGLTMTDLYPGDDWNFVFGYASLENRVAIYSLLRFDPLIIDPRRTATLEERRALILRRGLKLMSHELTHAFGMRHCIHYDCLMNGANHIGETDSHPMHACPVCLRKLHVATGFDPVVRYEQLGEFYREHGLLEQATWVSVRLAYLEAAAVR
jgi:archaemetzincin